MTRCRTTIKYPVFIDCNGVNPNAQQIEYEAFPNKGEVSISTSEVPAIIPLANAFNAGLMSPEQFSSFGRTDISADINSGGSDISINGNNKCGTITVTTGTSGQSGTIFTHDISSHIASGSIIVFSDINDNYAMGHYQVVSMEINSSKQIVLKAKDGITLEPSTIYKWSYQINA